ncbi:MAG: lamin tail domain-containing protein [Deltaproteobacteria bacterium]|nr:lamin tail domain-containing protein [Deltaproteobacteria bacterium]
MRKLSKWRKAWVLGCTVGLGLVACGDDGGTTTDTRDTADTEVIFDTTDTSVTPDTTDTVDTSDTTDTVDTVDTNDTADTNTDAADVEDVADADDTSDTAQPDGSDVADATDVDDAPDSSDVSDVADTAVEDTVADTASDVAPDTTPASFCGDNTCDANEDCLGCAADCACPESCGADLFISEYVEPSAGNNKAIEIANFTGREVELSEYEVWKRVDGGDFGTGVVTKLVLPSQKLAHGAVFTICNGQGDALPAAACWKTSSGVTTFNGNDAIALRHNGVTIDVIGDATLSGDGWAVAGTASATKDHTLSRKPTVVDSTDVWTTNVATWNVLAAGTYTGLGSHVVAATCRAIAPPTVFINEVVPGTGNTGFIEIATALAAPTDLGGWSLVTTAGSLTFPVGTTLAAQGFLAVDAEGLGVAVGQTEIVWLYDDLGDQQDTVGFVAADLGTGPSWGRLPDVTGPFQALGLATPNAPNMNPGPTCGDTTCDATEDCESCLADCGHCRPLEGDLVITEVMADPTTGPEWFEVVNLASVPLELSGVELLDDDIDFHVISAGTSFVVAPGEIFVLGSAAASYVDLVFAGFSLDPAGDAIVLRDGTEIIDRVHWTETLTSGVAWSLSASKTTAAANDTAASWCSATGSFEAGLGTPGVANPVCTGCGDGTCGDGETCTTCAADCGTCPVAGCATEIFFSEYIEGASNNKALEIANFTGATVDLSQYEIWSIQNGGANTTWTSRTATTALSGSLENGKVIVLCHSSSNATILAACPAGNRFSTNPVNFNGNDAVGLAKKGAALPFDAIGTTGTAPAVGWDVAGTVTATANHTLVRKPSVNKGNIDWTAAAAGEWTVLAQDTATGLGAHTVDYTCAP